MVEVKSLAWFPSQCEANLWIVTFPLVMLVLSVDGAICYNKQTSSRPGNRHLSKLISGLVFVIFFDYFLS